MNIEMQIIQKYLFYFNFFFYIILIKALDLYEEALEVDQDNEIVMSNIALIYLKMN